MSEDCSQCGSWHRAGFGCPVAGETAEPVIDDPPDELGEVCAWCARPGRLPLHRFGEEFCSVECENEWIERNEPWDRDPAPRIGDES